MELIARVNRPSVASELWFQNASQAAAGGDRDLRLVYNLDRLTQTPHFRSYWLQRNTAALREFSSGIADLERTGAEVRERRVLLRTNPTPDATGSGAAGARTAYDARGEKIRALMRPGTHTASSRVARVPTLRRRASAVTQ